MKQVLIYGGNRSLSALPPYFNGWEQVPAYHSSADSAEPISQGKPLESLPGRGFEAIACYHHLDCNDQDELSRVLDGFRRVLKPRGFVDIRINKDAASLSGFTGASLRRALQKSGFPVVATSETGGDIHAFAFPRFPRTEVTTPLGLSELQRIKNKESQSDAPSNSALIARGARFETAGRYEDAERCYRDALGMANHDSRSWARLGELLLKLDRTDEALDYLKQAAEIDSESSSAWSNLSVAQLQTGARGEALRSVERALDLDPGNDAAQFNLVVVLKGLGQMERALRACDRALGRDPSQVDLMWTRASILHFTGRFREALYQYLEIQNSGQEKPVEGPILKCKLSLGDWVDYGALKARIQAAIEQGQSPVPPMVLLTLTDDAARQQQYMRRRSETKISPAEHPVREKDNRIRVAYLSADFREHPTSYLLAGTIETHDRARFEAIGLSLMPVDETAMCKRMQRAFDQFHDIGRLDDAEADRFIRTLKVDILVDLMGFTGFSRSKLVARKPAPINVNYLGFPATSGAAYMDYIIADRYVIPRTLRRYYDEAVVHLPDCFQANDDRRPRPNGSLTRNDIGLPADAIVFCAFNQLHKTAPEAFECWMKILTTVPNGVIWIYCRDRQAQDNIRQHARLSGITADRLFFAARTNYANHLGRLHLADIFLDAFPFNGGATASDALWSGLPIVTLSGRAFASRMAGSLLSAMGFPELIAEDWQQYEEIAVGLARSPETLQRLKAELHKAISSSPVFDTVRFTGNLERAYEEMMRRHQNGLAPGYIEVSSPAGGQNCVGMTSEK